MSKTCPLCDRIYEDEHIFCAADGSALQGGSVGDNLIDSVIDERYVITALLGEGGMGRVYLGHHVHLPRKVAVKVLHARLTNDPAAVARFTREASSTSRIENPHVARVFDFGRLAGGGTYLAMEYIPGPTLSWVLDQEGMLPTARVVSLIAQLADGLGAAHRLDIVHRDLKPDNVLLMTMADGQECAKIVDFGIAKAIGPDNDDTLTSPGFVTGTPQYMSPEQFLGSTIDCRSDVFALGLLAFRALTNTLPFAAPTPERGFSAVLMDAPLRLDQAVPTRAWPGGLQSVFDRVLSREPSGRYASAAAFANALRDAMDDNTRPMPTGGVRALPAPGNRDEDNVIRRPRWIAPTIGVLVLVAAALVLVVMRNDSGPLVAPVSSNVVQPSIGDSTIRFVTPTPANVDSVTAVARAPVIARASTRPVAQPPSVDTALPSARVMKNSNDINARLDVVRDSLDALLLADEGHDDPAHANALVARLDVLLPSARTAADSARAYLLKANLLKLAGDRSGACSTLSRARGVATSEADRKSVTRNTSLYGC